MKSNLVFVRFALASIFALTALSAAAMNPLNNPSGLAVASNGNLYVANTGANNVLVYSPAHAQLAAKTITAGISTPTAVAFDASGNLWVANAGNNSITARPEFKIPAIPSPLVFRILRRLRSTGSMISG